MSEFEYASLKYEDTTVTFQVLVHLQLLGWVVSILALAVQLFGVSSRTLDRMFPGTCDRPSSLRRYEPSDRTMPRRSCVHVSAKSWGHGL